MEDTLRVIIEPDGRVAVCLNPCFNGRYSQRKRQTLAKSILTRLNPCFNGRYSQRQRDGADQEWQ